MRTPMTHTDRALAARWGWPLPTMAGGDGEPGDEPKKPDPPKEKEPLEGDRVPLATYEKERQKRQDLEQRLADLEARQEEHRQAELTETERLKEQVSQLTARAEKAEKAVARSERSQWVIDAAVEAGFEKPAAAVKLIDDIESLESAKDASEAVKKVAKEYAGLLRESNGGGPKLEQVLKDGKPPEPGTGDEQLLSQEELKSLSLERQRELEKSNPGLVERSLAAVGT
jgi:hypothetical protein